MKIGYYITHFPYKNHVAEYMGRYHCGGAELATHHLAINMAQRGHEIDVFTTSINLKDSFENYENINVYRYGTNFRIETANVSLGIFKKALKHRVDIIHAFLSLPPVPIAGLVHAKWKKIPFVLTYHGDPQANYGSFIRKTTLSLYNALLHDKLLSYANVILSRSEYYVNESRFLRKYKDKIVAIPTGINIEAFNFSYSKEESREKLGLPINGKIILFVGALATYKGPDILIKAMSRIVKIVPDTMLIFVGAGMLKKELEMLSKELAVEKSIKFVGFIDDAFKKTLYYKASDVFALPSTMTTESFGTVNLEAMACGIPIVASEIGGIPSIVKDGENGLLVTPKDSDALADAIIYLLENEDVRKKMGKNGLEEAKNYSWKRVTEETEKVYMKMLTKRSELEVERYENLLRVC